MLEAAIGRLPFLTIEPATAPFYFYLGADFIVLAGIAFDSKTLRVIAEAEGAINVYVTALPAL